MYVHAYVERVYYRQKQIDIMLIKNEGDIYFNEG